MFSVSEMYLWMIPLLPLLGSVVIVAVGRRWFPDQCHIPCIAGAVGACAFSILAFMAVMNHEGSTPIKTGANAPWIKVDDLDKEKGASVEVFFSLRADALTAVMLVMVTFVGSLIAI